MNEKEFLKQVSEYNMPDILEVKKSCIEQLNSDGKKQYTHVRFAGVAVIAILVLCICVTPISSLASNFVRHIQVMLNVNDETVELGNMDETDIRIPDDCEEVKSDGETYLSKAYNTLPDLIKDIQTDIYAWMGEDKFINQGIMLNIAQKDYGRITLLYDVAQREVIDNDDDNIDLQSVDMFVYFPLSSKTSMGNILLENEQLKYATIDEKGNIEKYEQNTKYQLIEQYKSANLDTIITVISSKSDTNGNGDLGKITESDTLYYIYFTLDGMCYQINCVGTLDMAHDVIENIKKTNITDGVKYSSINEESETNDLLYRTINEHSVSLEKGEKINILAMNGKEYDDVCISLIGQQTTQKIGLLNDDMPYTYNVTVSGEYAVYAGKNQLNVTDEIMIEHLCNMADGLYSLD